MDKASSRGDPGPSSGAHDSNKTYGTLAPGQGSSSTLRSDDEPRRRQTIDIDAMEDDDALVPDETDIADDAEPVEDEDEEDEEDEEEEEQEEDDARPSLRRRVTLRRHSSHAEDDRRSCTSIEREMTLKDRQEEMNKRHPFGLPLWKPALYKKSRSVVRRANNALHASPSSSPELFLDPGNIAWLFVFGWWLSAVTFILSLVMMCVPPNGRIYGLVLRELAFYLLWPFGRYVERHVEITPTPLSPQDTQHDDEEAIGLLNGQPSKRHAHDLLHGIIAFVRLGPAAWIYYLLFFAILAPLLMVVSTICWLCVITIPMAKLNYLLVRHLRRHPLSLRFKSSPSVQLAATGKPAVILLCTYQAIGWQYYKYTYDGINIIFINTMPLVFFVIFDDFVLKHYFPDWAITQATFLFMLSLVSVIPLSYFIGMGVSSISAQSSMGLAAAINATFGSIIEIILYSVALMNGKSRLVEGSLIGSFLAGVLLMPGMSMISGSVKRKEQRFNAKSAGVTATMLIMAIIGSLTPTLFYQMFGSFELKCVGCPDTMSNGTIACNRCYYDQMNPTIDPVYQNSVKPLMYICAAILPSAYVIGLVFSLHTHVEMVWNSAKPVQAQESYYQKLLPGHIISQLIHHGSTHAPAATAPPANQPDAHTHRQDHIHPAPASHHADGLHTSPLIAVKHPSAVSPMPTSAGDGSPSLVQAPVAFIHAKEPEEEEEEEEMAGHDSPNWSKTKSFTILFGCTLLYAIVAEILVDTVDIVMESIAIDEKFLGLTLFALVPNITEFMNAISFALYGNIVLSMEIGSAYALQVCLLQIPSMVAFSYWFNYGKDELADYTFSLVFPRWDVISVVFSVFLLTYTYQEGNPTISRARSCFSATLCFCLLFTLFPPFQKQAF
ncbi:Sodium/calcium exchanger protein-domain-containing protein [Gongronella butleri]|nr:Sodium/calcium exchanger protein-domain-containing protein [Gongronella butleri]